MTSSRFGHLLIDSEGGIVDVVISAFSNPGYLLSMLVSIDENQPKYMQLGRGKLEAAVKARQEEEATKRRCEVCRKEMKSGFCIRQGEAYYCSEKCLHEHFTEEEYEQMYLNDDAYWTEWEE